MIRTYTDALAEEERALDILVAELLLLGFDQKDIELRRHHTHRNYQEMYCKGICIASSQFHFEGEDIRHELILFPDPVLRNKWTKTEQPNPELKQLVKTIKTKLLKKRI